MVSAKGEDRTPQLVSACREPEQWQVASHPPHLLRDELPAPQNFSVQDARLMAADTLGQFWTGQ